MKSIGVGLRQIILWGTVLTLIGISTLVGHRYHTIQPLEAFEVYFAWRGWVVTLEEKVRDYYRAPLGGKAPLTACLPGCYPTGTLQTPTPGRSSSGTADFASPYAAFLSRVCQSMVSGGPRAL